MASEMFAGTGVGSSYEIASVDRLEESAGNLSNYNQQLTNNANSLEYIVNAIQQNWENSDGQDIQSILTNLNDALKKLTDEIQPVIGKYVETLNTIVLETRTTEGRTI